MEKKSFLQQELCDLANWMSRDPLKPRSHATKQQLNNVHEPLIWFSIPCSQSLLYQCCRSEGSASVAPRLRKIRRSHMLSIEVSRGGEMTSLSGTFSSIKRELRKTHLPLSTSFYLLPPEGSLVSGSQTWQSTLKKILQKKQNLQQL